MKHLSFIPKARAEYLATTTALEHRAKRAERKFKSTINGIIEAELYRRFKRGYWAVIWANSWDGGEITPFLEYSDDENNCVPLWGQPDKQLFPHIELWKSLRFLTWFWLKNEDIIIGLRDASQLFVVFPPEKMDLVETFFTENKFSLYKRCL